MYLPAISFWPDSVKGLKRLFVPLIAVAPAFIAVSIIGATTRPSAPTLSLFKISGSFWFIDVGPPTTSPIVTASEGGVTATSPKAAPVTAAAYFTAFGAFFAISKPFDAPAIPPTAYWSPVAAISSGLLKPVTFGNIFSIFLLVSSYLGLK